MNIILLIVIWLLCGLFAGLISQYYVDKRTVTPKEWYELFLYGPLAFVVSILFLVKILK